MISSATANRLVVPDGFKPPIVKNKSQGLAAFHAYDWYFEWMKLFLADIEKVFLTPCAVTKPIYASSLHRKIYEKFINVQEGEREILVVSEPVVLIRYEDLYKLEHVFFYDFPPKLLNHESRVIFVKRLQILLSDKDITGCLPKHHASLIYDAIGQNWKNYWQGDIFYMMKKAKSLENK